MSASPSRITCCSTSARRSRTSPCRPTFAACRERKSRRGPASFSSEEPFGALDALTRLQGRMDLEALWLRRRPTVLFITHSVEEAVGLSDRILVMSASPGELVEEIKVEL